MEMSIFDLSRSWIMSNRWQIVMFLATDVTCNLVNCVRKLDKNHTS